MHGSGFYFVRDDAFDKDPFSVRGGKAVPDPNPPPFQTEQYGVTVGGPIVRDKAFFFVSLERRTDENRRADYDSGFGENVRGFIERRL